MVAFEGLIGLVIECVCGGLGEGGLEAGLEVPIVFPYRVITTYAVTLRF